MKTMERLIQLLAKDVDFNDKRTTKYVDTIYRTHLQYRLQRAEHSLRMGQGISAKRKAKKTLTAALTDPLLSLQAKNYIACMAVDLRPATLWALEHVRGEILRSVIIMGDVTADKEILEALIRNKPLDKETCTMVLQRPLFLRSVIRVKGGLKVPANSYFLQRLNDEIFKEMLTILFFEYPSMGLPLWEIASRARKVYNLDEGIPDEWVAKMFA